MVQGLVRRRADLNDWLTLEAFPSEVRIRLGLVHLGKMEGAYLGYREQVEVREERQGWRRSERLRYIHHSCQSLQEPWWKTKDRSHPSMPCVPQAEHEVPLPTAVGSHAWLFLEVVG